MKVPDLFVGKRLFVGDGLPVALGIGPAEIRGSAYVEGPFLTGAPIFAGPEANVMISRCTNPEALLPPSIIKVRGLIAPTPIDVVVGDPAGPVGINCFCGTSTFVVQAAMIDLITAKYFCVASLRSEVASIAKDIAQRLCIGTKTELGVDHNFSLAMNSAPIIGKTITKFNEYATKITTLNTTFSIATKALAKCFDINHPTKKGYRLRHSCPEAPQNDVYYRGRMENTTTINLPDYWRGLVDPESIGVNLTPMGSYQDLYVEKIEWGTKVTVKNASGGPIKCSYVVFAERKDVEKLIPEYEGETPESYPGNNDVYDTSGWNK